MKVSSCEGVCKEVGTLSHTLCIQCLLSLWPLTHYSALSLPLGIILPVLTRLEVLRHLELKVSLTAAMTVPRALLHEAEALFCRCHSGHLRSDQGASPGLRSRKQESKRSNLAHHRPHFFVCVGIMLEKWFFSSSEIKLLLRSTCRRVTG